MKIYFVFPVFFIFVLSRSAVADDEPAVSSEIDAAEVKVGEEEKVKEEKPEGWEDTLALGANFSYGQSKNVVGNPDGATMQFGLLLSGTANYRKGRHKWLNAGKLVHTETRTPTLEMFVKSADELNLKTTYFYSPKKIDWLGPFGRATLATALFPGYYIAAGDGEIRDMGREYDESAGEDGESYQALTKYYLTGNFEPLLMKEVVGVLANPVDEGKKLNLTCHVGAGAEEMLAQGGYVLADDDATTYIEIKALDSYTSVGAELEMSAEGTLKDYINWTANATFFQPVYTTAEDAVIGIDLLNIDLSGKVSVKLAKWASLDIVAVAKKYPLILDEWQLQTGVLLSTTFNLL